MADTWQAWRVSPARRAVVAALVVEAVVVGGYGAFLGLETVIAEATERVAAAFLALFALALGAGLAGLARAVAKGWRGARAPVVLWQLLQASIAVPALGPRWYVGVGLLVLCVVAGVGVLRADVLPGDD